MEKLKRIIIGGKTYPMKMDLNVLEHIQDNYGSVSQFERDILGLKWKKDEKGNQIYKEDGTPMLDRTEPSIRAIKMALPMMINEGMEIEAEETGKEFAPVSEQEVFRTCTISFELLAQMIHGEFKRCFETKK